MMSIGFCDAENRLLLQGCSNGAFPGKRLSLRTLITVLLKETCVCVLIKRKMLSSFKLFY